MSLILLNFYYRPNGETFTYEISPFQSINEISNIVIKKLSLSKQPKDIGYVYWSKDEKSRKYLKFEDLQESAKLNETVEVISSAHCLFSTLVDHFNSNRIKDTEEMVKEVCKYAQDSEMSNAISSTPDGMQILFKIGASKWAKKSDIWSLIFIAFSNSSYSLSKEDVEILYSKIRDINAPIDVIKTLDVYVSNTDDEIDLSIISDLVRVSSAKLREPEEATHTASLLNNFAAKVNKFHPEAVQSFYNSRTFKLMYTQIEHLKESAAEEYQGHLIVTQNFIINMIFSKLIATAYDTNNADHSERMKVLQEKFEDIKGFIRTPDDFRYFDADHGGIFLLEAFDYLISKKTGQFFADTIQSVVKFNGSVRSNEKIPFLEAGCQAISAMKYLFDQIKSETSAESYAAGLLKPLFLETYPAKELFCLLFKVFFENWKKMEGSVQIIENLFNFTRHQIDIILTSGIVRNFKHFKEYDRNFPSYQEESHNWLKMDIKKIVKEEIQIHPQTLKEMSDNLHETILKIISKSFIQQLKKNPVSVVKVHKIKEKRNLQLSLNDEYAFQVVESRTDGETISSTLFQVSNFVSMLTSIKDMKKHISDDDYLVKKLRNNTAMLLFKNPTQYLLFEYHAEDTNLQVLHDSLLHLSRKKMESHHFEDIYQKLRYIFLKVQLFELEGRKIPKTIPKVPELPQDIEAAFDH